MNLVTVDFSIVYITLVLTKTSRKRFKFFIEESDKGNHGFGPFCWLFFI